MRGTSKKITKEIPKGKYWNEPKFPRLVDTFVPYDQKGWWFHKTNTKFNNRVPETRTTYSNAVMSIYQAIGELMLENEGGVELEEYGYFTAAIIPWKTNGRDYKYNKDPYFHTNGQGYALQFYSDIFQKSCIKGMIMDRTFDHRIKKKFHKQMYNGFRPKLYYTLMRSVHANPARKDI